MIDNDDFWDEKEKKYIKRNQDEESKKRLPGFILLFLVIGVGGLFALGLSLSALGILNGNETINTIISSLTGDDGKDKYIITYVENIIGEGEDERGIIKDDFLHIIGAKVSDTKGGAKGEVVFFGGLLLTTKNTFPSGSSSVTYEVIIKNDSSSDKTFEKLLFDPNGDVKYTMTGLNPGDTIKPGEEAKIYITVEPNGNLKYPATIESSVDISYRKDDKGIHITDAKVSDTKNGGKGEVEHFEGLFLATKNTFSSGSSSVTYEVNIKNDSSSDKTFDKLLFDPNGDVKYTISGIKNGDTLKPGEETKVYITVEPNGNLKYPVTIESSVDISFRKEDKGIHIADAIVNGTKNGGKGKVEYFEGLFLTTNNTFESKNSQIEYKVTIKNDSDTSESFNGLIFDPNGDVKYTISGIKNGDVLKPGESVVAYVLVEPNGNLNYPTTVESSVDISYGKEEKGIHITDAKVNGTKNGGKGKVEYFEGLFLTTNNTFESKDSQVGYKVTIKNDSSVPEAYSGIVFDPNGDVKYTISGIKNGDILEPGESVVVYVLVEPNGDLKYPTTVESSTEFRFATFTVNETPNGINLVNQFPTPDEQGKLFEGTNYVYNFTLILGKKSTGAYYELTGIENKDNNLDPSYVKIYLEKNGQAVPFTIRDNGRVKTFNEFKNSTHEGAEGKVILSDHVTQEDVNRGKIQFKLRMWISEDVKVNENNMNLFNNKKFGLRVNTYAQFEV